jgi:hypothetical protein
MSDGKVRTLGEWQVKHREACVAQRRLPTTPKFFIPTFVYQKKSALINEVKFFSVSAIIGFVQIFYFIYKTRWRHGVSL